MINEQQQQQPQFWESKRINKFKRNFFAFNTVKQQKKIQQPAKKIKKSKGHKKK